jgi:uncharacterized damage-inducible protein DinB
MDFIARLKQDFAYNAWANRVILDAVVAATSPPPRVIEIMAHLVGAEWAWLRRLGPKSPDMPVWPNLSLDECDRQLRTLSATWRTYLDALTPAELDRDLSYVNFKGERWTNKVDTILTHVFTHGFYHRGQIAGFLGRAGDVAPLTDYIEYVRRGHVAEGWSR